MNRKLMSAVLALSILLSLAAVPAGPGLYSSGAEPDRTRIGDINFDASVNAKDYTILKRAVLRTYSLTVDQWGVADINSDGNVDAKDYVMLKRIVLGTYHVNDQGQQDAVDEYLQALSAFYKTYKETDSWTMDSEPTSVLVKGEPDYDGFHPTAIVKDLYGGYLVQFSSSDEAADFYNSQKQNKNVELCEFDRIVGDVNGQIGTNATDSFIGSWGSEYMEAGQLADYIVKKNRNNELIVAVLDTGVDYNHQILSPRMVDSGINLVEGNRDAMDEHNGSHGTLVAGIIAYCTKGLNIKLLPVKVLNEEGKGSISTVYNGIKMAADAGAKVINLSLTVNEATEGGSVHIADAVKYAVSKGAVVCAAAGNDNANTNKFSPANSLVPGVVVVSAIYRNEIRRADSNYGASVDLCAPGEDIFSTSRDDSYKTISKTSAATPHVSAAAAMVCQLYPNKNPAEIEAFLKTCVKDLGAQGWDEKYGCGTLKLSKAISNEPVVLQSVSVAKRPNKTQYFVGDRLDLTGLELTALYSDGTSETITQGFSSPVSVLNNPGTQNIRVTYGETETAFTVTVSAIELTELLVDKTPDKVTYFIGTEVDTSGLVLTARYNNGKQEEIRSGFSVVGATVLSTLGKQQVVVSWGGKSVGFAVEVIENRLIDVSLLQMPDKTVYVCGESFDPKGMALLETYQDGSQKRIESGFDYTPKVMSESGSQRITILHKGLAVGLDVYVNSQVVPEVISSIGVHSEPKKKQYTLGETLDLNGLAIIVYYSNGSTRVIDSGFSYQPVDMNSTGMTPVVVEYESFTATFYITISEPVVELTSISIVSNPAKTDYYAGDVFRTEGLTVDASYSNGTKKRLNLEDCVISNPSMTTPGTKSVTITYGGKSASFNISIRDLYISWSLLGYNESSASFATSVDYPCGTVSWESTNASVATIAENGKILVKDRTGSPVITASVNNNGVIRKMSKTLNISNTVGTKYKETVSTTSSLLLYGKENEFYNRDITQSETKPIPSYSSNIEDITGGTVNTDTGRVETSFSKTGNIGYVYYHYCYSNHSANNPNNPEKIINYRPNYRKVTGSNGNTSNYLFKLEFSFQFYDTTDYREYSGNQKGGKQYYAYYWAHQDTLAGYPWYVCEGMTGAWSASYYRFELTEYRKTVKTYTTYCYSLSS